MAVAAFKLKRIRLIITNYQFSPAFLNVGHALRKSNSSAQKKIKLKKQHTYHMDQFVDNILEPDNCKQTAEKS